MTAEIYTTAIRVRFDCASSQPVIMPLCNEVDRLRARLVEVEAERSDLAQKATDHLIAWRKAEARLAAVEALCDDFYAGKSTGSFAAHVRAVARGEGDRPADTSYQAPGAIEVGQLMQSIGRTEVGEDAHGVYFRPAARGEGDRPAGHAYVPDPDGIDRCWHWDSVWYRCGQRAADPTHRTASAGGPRGSADA